MMTRINLDGLVFSHYFAQDGHGSRVSQYRVNGAEVPQHEFDKRLFEALGRDGRQMIVSALTRHSDADVQADRMLARHQ